MSHVNFKPLRLTASLSVGSSSVSDKMPASGSLKVTNLRYNQGIQILIWIRLDPVILDYMDLVKVKTKQFRSGALVYKWTAL